MFSEWQWKDVIYDNIRKKQCFTLSLWNIQFSINNYGGQIDFLELNMK